MKRFIVALAVAYALVAVFAGCDNAALDDTPVVIKLASGLESSAPDLSLRAVSPGDPLETISSYRVVFKKVEIGNSETEKFTLWESEAGEEKDVALPVSFDNVLPVIPGTYNYVRLTIGEVLSADGSLTDPDTSVVYTGTGSCILDGTVYVWGTDIPNVDGELTIQEPVRINGDTTLNIRFAVAGTISYQGGPETGADFNVTKPVMHLIAE